MAAPNTWVSLFAFAIFESSMWSQDGRENSHHGDYDYYFHESKTFVLSDFHFLTSCFFQA
jgi:hypothetical protein